MYRYVFYACVIFITSTILGYYAAATNEEEIVKIFSQISEELSQIDSSGPVTLFLVIFFNNSFKVFLSMMLGVFLGIAPILFVFGNGLILGIVSFFIIQQAGLTFLLLGILPHGIIEIPAVLFGAGYGMWLGNPSYRKLRFGEPLNMLKIRENLRTAMFAFKNYLIPLIFFAAFVEVFVTNSILHIFLV